MAAQLIYAKIKRSADRSDLEISDIIDWCWANVPDKDWMYTDDVNSTDPYDPDLIFGFTDPADHLMFILKWK